MNESRRLISNDNPSNLILYTPPASDLNELNIHLLRIIMPSSHAPSHSLRQGIKVTLIMTGGVLSYLVCIPSFLTAGKFNAFPGAAMLSSIATLINYGTFGADQYRELASIIFDTSP